MSASRAVAVHEPRRNRIAHVLPAHAQHVRCGAPDGRQGSQSGQDLRPPPDQPEGPRHCCPEQAGRGAGLPAGRSHLAAGLGLMHLPCCTSPACQGVQTSCVQSPRGPSVAATQHVSPGAGPPAGGLPAAADALVPDARSALRSMAFTRFASCCVGQSCRGTGLAATEQQTLPAGRSGPSGRSTTVGRRWCCVPHTPSLPGRFRVTLQYCLLQLCCSASWQPSFSGAP